MKLGEDLLRHAGLGKFEHDAHAVTIGFVAQVSQTIEPAAAGDVGDALDQIGFIDLIGQLGDDDT